MIFTFRLTWGFESSEPPKAYSKGVCETSVHQSAILFNYRPPGSSIPKLETIKILGLKEYFGTKLLEAPCILEFSERNSLNKEGSHALVTPLYLLIFLEEKYIASNLSIYFKKSFQTIQSR